MGNIENKREKFDARLIDEDMTLYMVMVIFLSRFLCNKVAMVYLFCLFFLVLFAFLFWPAPSQSILLFYFLFLFSSPHLFESSAIFRPL